MSGRWSERLQAFFGKYGYRFLLANQPAGHALSLISKMRARRAVDFASLAKIVNAIDGRSPNTEPVRLSKSSPILIDANMDSIGGERRILMRPAECFIHAARVLIFTHIVVSARDPAGKERCHFDAASAHVSAVEQNSRKNTTHNHALRNKIMGARRRFVSNGL